MGHADEQRKSDQPVHVQPLPRGDDPDGGGGGGAEVTGGGAP